MRTQLAIYTLADELLADWSTRVTACRVRTSAHGYESCEADLQLPFYEAFNYYQQFGPLKLKVTWGSYRIWEGRLEDPTQFVDTQSGLRVTAFGAWVAYNDAPYTALWSDTQTDHWVPLNTQNASFAQLERFENAVNDGLYMAARKNESFSNAFIGAFGYVIPDQSGKNIVGISFDVTFKAPNVDWQFRVDRRDASWVFVGNEVTLTTTITQITRSYNLVITGTANITFGLFYGNVAAVYAGETGDTFFRVSNVRVVTSTANRINTTLTANRNAGVNVTATVGSTARMYVGQKLQMKSGGNPSETVTVLSIGSATQFNATFVGNYVIGDAVQAHVVYPDEVIKDCVSTLNVLNPTQVDSDVTQIQSQAVDLDQAIFEDVYPSEIINQLIAKSDNQTTPRQWVALVYNNETLIVRPRGTGLAWYTDITSLEVVRTLTQLYNSVYSVYSDVANKRKLRTAASTDATSVTKFQITRRKAVDVDTTNSVQATKIRDSILALQLDPIPRAKVTLDRIFDSYGSPFKLFFVKADDTLTIRNLPPVLNATFYDKIRTLVITRTDVDLLNDILAVELEVPMPDINVQIAKALGAKQ
jgi:hypothetical protein